MSEQASEWWFRIILPGLLLTAIALLWGIVAHFILRDAEVKVVYTRGYMRCPECGSARLSPVSLAQGLGQVVCSGCGRVSGIHRAVEAAEEEEES